MSTLEVSKFNILRASKGGLARAQKLSRKQRKDIARKGAAERWRLWRQRNGNA